MKRWIPWLVAALTAGWAFSSWRTPTGRTERSAAAAEFGRLPLLMNGRVQPFDSLARNTLLQIRGKQSANYEPWKGAFEKPETATAMEWLLEVMSQPNIAQSRKIFRIDHPDLKGLFGLTLDGNKAQRDDGKHYSWEQLDPKLKEFQAAVKDLPAESGNHNAFQRAVSRLHTALTLFMRYQNILRPMDARQAAAELTEFQSLIPSGVAAFQSRMAERSFDTNALTKLLSESQRYLAMEGMETPMVIPPSSTNPEWQRMSSAILAAALPVQLLHHLIGRKPLPESQVNEMLKTLGRTPIPQTAHQYAALVDAYRSGQYSEVRQKAAALSSSFTSNLPELKKVRTEQILNYSAPFYKTMIIYIAAFLLVGVFWLSMSEPSRRTAWWLVLAGLSVHTVGIICRMWLEGRPPVTNLYSSAVFIGWGAVVLGLVLEYFWRNAIGLAVASVLGFITLIVAHGLHGFSKDADTMAMLQAVLDTNFWLATHVVIVTLGYASTYVAGFLGVLYVVLGIFTRVLTPDMSRSLSRAVYGILCFATLFSFVGTVLGGIWADQSWGRFWGWDPKENGALIIVLWNALILHAKWGGMARERGVILLSLVGNIVTSWSWFGTNMLGIGLHSYGAMDAAFFWLTAFMLSQLLLIALGLLPQRLWRSRKAYPLAETQARSSSQPALA